MGQTGINVLYGAGKTTNSSNEIAYVEKKFAAALKEVWDGTSAADFPETAEEIRNDLLSFLDKDTVSFNLGDRFTHSFGSSSPEILLAKHNSISRIVDAVIFPTYENASQIFSDLLKRGYRAIIYGGGSSVSGSLTPGNESKLVSIDTRKLRHFAVKNNFVIVGSGWVGSQMEAELNRYGLTAGNFPESLPYSTVGGWVATKATGQESNQYGGIENIVIGTTMVTSSGMLQDKIVPRESAGLEARDIAIGSGGQMGLVTDVALKVFPLPVFRTYTSRIYHSFKEGIDALATIKNYPSVARLSDELETEFALNGAGDSLPVRFFKSYVSMRGYSRGSLLILINNDRQGTPVAGRSLNAGKQPALSWIKGRYSRPMIANSLWKMGLVPDTLETSTTWDNVFPLYTKVKSAFYSTRDAEGIRGEIMAHVSHLYKSGACIYFTFIIQSDDEISDLNRIRDVIVRTFVENNGALTHHHGTGSLFRKYQDSKLLELQERLSDPLLRRKNNGS